MNLYKYLWCISFALSRYVLIINKDYQKRDDVEGSATAKLKGVAYTNITDAPDLQIDDPTPYNRVWDLADYVIPPQVRTAGSLIKNIFLFFSLLSFLTLFTFSVFLKCLCVFCMCFLLALLYRYLFGVFTLHGVLFNVISLY